MDQPLNDLKAIFIAALDHEPGEARSAYLASACGDNEALRRRVEALLLAHDRADEVLGPAGLLASAPATNDSHADQPVTLATGVHTPTPGAPVSPVSMTADYQSDAKPNVLIAGRYTLQEKIGEGGMGEVWVAKQSEPVKRKVALKLIKQGMDSRAVLQRFEQERQALAMMDHPNIAKVFDAGVVGQVSNLSSDFRQVSNLSSDFRQVGNLSYGQPFFVMELVNGLPLNKFCDELKLTPKERLALFVPICQAVQHAHQKGIVHRDLKPANILITMIDAKPVPKVIDFGVAKATSGKLTDESMNTQFGAVVGTLEYMSPEQAGFTSEDIDTRADIYSLGVILYELLTGLRPIDAARLKKAALTEMIRIIREEEPSKPSTRLSTDASLPSLAALRQIEPRKLMTMLRGDLDWVVMKCLEKHRERRYETANALARDVQRYLDGDAVEACPPSVGYRMGKFLKRNKGPVLAASFVLLALVAGFIGTAYGLFRADRARQAEAAQRKIAVEQKSKAEASEALAKAQRSRAEQREEQAIDAVKKFRDAVANNPELKNNSALEPLRKTLLKEPLAFFKALRDRLQADRDTRPESLARLAQASFDLGNLTNEIGDKQDALLAYRESLAIRQKLADASPDSTQFQSDLAASHGNIGLLLSETGKSAEALKAYESALAIQQKLADANPTVTDFRYQLASSHNNLGLVLRATGKPADALKEHKAALAIRRKLADANPTFIGFQHVLAASYHNIGMVLRDTGKPAKALEAHETALAILQKLADANPKVTQFQRDRAASHDKIGALLREIGKPAEALNGYESALAILQKLADANPTVTDFQYQLAASHANIGLVLSETGKPAEALNEYEVSQGILQKLADANPTVTQFRRDLANSYDNIGQLLSATGKPAEALKAYESAQAIRRKLADSNPKVIHFQRDLASSYNNLGILLRDFRKLDEALKAFESARTIQLKLVDANPTVTRFQSELATSHIHIGHMLSETGRPAEALKEYESALPILEKLARQHPESPDYASTLGVTLQGMAKIDIDAGRFDAARDALLRAIACQKKALATNPRNPLYRDCLDRHLNNLIIAARALGDSKGMAEAERELATLRDSDPAMIALDARLSAVLHGDQAPEDQVERLKLAQRAYDKALYVTAARLWAEALAADPRLGDDRQLQHRYNAACASALAASSPLLPGEGGRRPGEGVQVPRETQTRPSSATARHLLPRGEGNSPSLEVVERSLTDPERAKLRTQALDWLKAELAVWSELVESSPTQAKAVVVQTLAHWKQDADLTGIRDQKELAKLPESERKEWQSLWADVGALLAKAKGG